MNKEESMVALLGGLSKVDMAVLFGNLNKAWLALYQLESTWSWDILGQPEYFEIAVKMGKV